jgi:hypothetical protein
MESKLLRGALIVLMFTGLLPIFLWSASIRVQAATDNSVGRVGIQVVQTGPVYSQPMDPHGKRLLSAWLDPDGSDYDQYVWDDFVLPNGGTITAVEWYGGYDPLFSGRGGPVADFTVSIYPSIAAGTEPAVANPPLVEYHTEGNAGETAYDTVNGMQVNIYSFSLPASFVAEAGAKYWIYIVASQHGNTPDWSFLSATGGNGNHYIRTSGAGGDVMYRFMPGDAAFMMLGAATASMTPTHTVAAATHSNTSAAPSTNVPGPTSTPIPKQIPICLGFIMTFMMLMVFFSDLRITKS